ncbi:GGDEF domain-containing protein [Xanthobacter sp. V2C-8]|uniref:GGDEF domain-containing protein n=1 Tax=Xanthobacter albus TaxID=3119929 RepID=UPI003729B543
MTLHVPTILLASAAMSGLIAMLQFVVSPRLQNHALRYWAVSNLAAATGTVLLGLRPVLPLALSVIVGNGLVFAALGLVLAGVRVFDGRRPMLGTVFAGTLAGAGLLFLSMLSGDDLGQRIVITSLVITAWCALAAALLFRQPERDDWSLARGICAGLLCVMATLHAARAAAVAGGWTNPEVAYSGIVQAVLVLAAVGLSISWNFCSLYMVLDRLASIDDLTGLPNRRTTLRRGRNLFNEAIIRQRALSILMVDLDHFKSINDRFGHHVGDAVLRRFAEAAARGLRSGDVIGRLGGEEFCVILPGADAIAGREVGERLRRIAEGELSCVADLPVNATVTVGVATLHPDGQAVPALSSLIRAADEALYVAKGEGRNRVLAAAWPSSYQHEAQRADITSASA